MNDTPCYPYTHVYYRLLNTLPERIAAAKGVLSARLRGDIALLKALYNATAEDSEDFSYDGMDADLIASIERYRIEDFGVVEQCVRFN